MARSSRSLAFFSSRICSASARAASNHDGSVTESGRPASSAARRATMPFISHAMTRCAAGRSSGCPPQSPKPQLSNHASLKSDNLRMGCLEGVL
eukprot:gene1510-biopygen7062